MPASHRLDLSAIEHALRKVQSRFAELSQHFTEQRDPLTDEVLLNVVEGYALIDDYVARGVDLPPPSGMTCAAAASRTAWCFPAHCWEC